MSWRRAFVRRIFDLESADGYDHPGGDVKRRIYFGRDDRLDDRDVVWFGVFQLEADRVDDARIIVKFREVGPAVGVAMCVVPGHKDER